LVVILIYGAQGDTCASSLYAELRNRGCEAVLVDNPYDTNAFGLNWLPEADLKESYIVLDGKTIPLTDISGVMLRYSNPQEPGSQQGDGDSLYVGYEVSAALLGMLHALKGTVINRPVPGVTGKPLFSLANRIQVAQCCGFCIAPIRVAATRNGLLDFEYETAIMGGMDGRMPPRLTTKEGLKGHLDEVFGEREIVPLYLQQVPRGTYIQVVVVGEEIYAAGGKAPTLACDAQCESLPPLELSPELQSRCRQLARDLGIVFAQFCLVEAEDGKCYCLNATEFPSLEYFGQELSGEIVSSLANLFTREGGAKE
jgi:hypothetical protein